MAPVNKEDMFSVYVSALYVPSLSVAAILRLSKV
jgi:hypothetical protein